MELEAVQELPEATRGKNNMSGIFLRPRRKCNMKQTSGETLQIAPTKIKITTALAAAFLLAIFEDEEIGPTNHDVQGRPGLLTSTLNTISYPFQLFSSRNVYQSKNRPAMSAETEWLQLRQSLSSYRQSKCTIFTFKTTESRKCCKYGAGRFFPIT